MNERFYLDTSIWLDFFEDRNEHNLKKGDFAKNLISEIVENGDKIVVSEVIKNELIGLKFSHYDIENLFFPYRKIIILVYSTKKQFGKAKDISKKRNIPLLDALHAILARDYGAIMVTRDRHFQELLDIIKSKKPEEII
ncbi:MAG: PIN domain-containing protein [Nanoarchaeota archaeon]